MWDRKGVRGRVALGLLAASMALAAEARALDQANERASRVGIHHVDTRNAVTSAVSGAQRRLSQPRCQRLLSEFKDGGGRPLLDRLSALDQTSHDYLELVLFRDGQTTPQCVRRPDTLAYTSAGSRVVFVCGQRFARHRQKDPVFAEFVIIHEALHTLGLGENPPYSAEITARVSASCR
jgi:hypothetical protein